MKPGLWWDNTGPSGRTAIQLIGGAVIQPHHPQWYGEVSWDISRGVHDVRDHFGATLLYHAWVKSCQADFLQSCRIKDRNPECEAQFHSPPYRALSHHGSPNNTLIMHMVISICHYWHFHNTSHSWQWFMNQTQLFTSPIPATPSSPTPGSNTLSNSLNNTLFSHSWKQHY